jgi:carbamoyl-phosphate synthase large subunit
MEGTVFISVNDRDKAAAIPIAGRLSEMGFHIVATKGTCDCLADKGIVAERIYKIQEGRPNIVDAIKNKSIDLMINTPAGVKAQADDPKIRRAALQYGIPYTTTLAGASAATDGIAALKASGTNRVRSLQEYHQMEDTSTR